MDANKTKLIYPQLSYKLVGLLFEVHKELGGKYQEKYYQRAVEKILQEKGLAYQKEVQVDLRFKEAKIGKYFLDFVIDGKIVLELKASPILHPDDFRQVLAYLKAHNLKLGILANFRGTKLVYKRILNSEINL
mgnify:CR=1 FL=1